MYILWSSYTKFKTYFLLQEMIVPNSVIDLPPPSPPKPKTIVLPPNWKVARDPEGKIYYYHIVTRLVKLCCRGVLCVCLSKVLTSILRFIYLFIFPLGKHSGIHQPGKEIVTTLVWTMNQRWTWEHPPMMKILPKWAFDIDYSSLKDFKKVNCCDLILGGWSETAGFSNSLHRVEKYLCIPSFDNEKESTLLIR